MDKGVTISDSRCVVHWSCIVHLEIRWALSSGGKSEIVLMGSVDSLSLQLFIGEKNWFSKINSKHAFFGISKIFISKWSKRALPMESTWPFFANISGQWIKMGSNTGSTSVYLEIPRTFIFCPTKGIYKSTPSGTHLRVFYCIRYCCTKMGC